MLEGWTRTPAVGAAGVHAGRREGCWSHPTHDEYARHDSARRKVSIFRRGTDSATALQDYLVSEVISRVRGDYDRDDHLRPEAETIAALRSGNDPQTQDQLKKTGLGAFTPAGCFKRRRKGWISSRSGLTVVDVDGLEPEKTAVLRDRAEDLPGCVVAFRSPRGRGVKFLVRFDPVPRTSQEHDAATRIVMAAYTLELGVDVDPSGKDESRLCYFSRDPDLKVLPETAPFRWDPTADVPDLPKLPAKSGRAPAVAASSRSARVMRASTPDDLRAAAAGNRNNILNAGVYHDARARQLTAERRAEWIEAAGACGLVRDDGIESVTATMKSAKAAGTANPLSSRRAWAVASGEHDPALSRLWPVDSDARCRSEAEIVDQLAKSAAGRLRFVEEESSWWLFHDGEGWRQVSDRTLVKAVMAFGQATFGQDKYLNGEARWARNPRVGGRYSTARGAIYPLGGDHRVRTVAADWDAEPPVLGLPDGKLLNLDTGERRPVEPVDLVRRKLAATPATEGEYRASRFRALVEHVIPDDQEREYLRRRLGAALGDVPGMDDLVALIGPAGSGKGCLLAALGGAFGSYRVGVPATQLIRRSGPEAHPEWKARLAGARLMVADDLPAGNLDPDVIKGLLGTEVTARPMRGSSFDFTVNAPLLTTSNHPPSLSAADGAVDRRLKPIRCGEAVADPDPEVRAAMATPREWAAVLYWLETGYRDCRRGGCPVPRSVRDATAEIRAGTPLTEFSEQFEPGSQHTSREVYAKYERFARERHERPMGRNKLTQILKREYGWSDHKGTKGLRLLIVPPVHQPDTPRIHWGNRPDGRGGAFSD